MSNLTKGFILIGVIIAIGFGLVIWKKNVGGSVSASFNSISRQEIELLISDVVKTNPMVVKRLNEDPDMKKQQIENLKQLLAFASQAQREGLVNDPSNRQELKSIRAEVMAVNYDREVNQDKGPMPAFGFITEEQTNAYWQSGVQAPAEKGFFGKMMDNIGLGDGATAKNPEDEFNDFLNAKIAVMKASNPEMGDREISEEERTQARDIFAKIRIYQAEYQQKARAGELPQEFIDKTNLQIKLQQAQFLARLYAEKATELTKVTDEEVDKYIAENPDLDPQQKRAQAQEILDKAKAGEDFAALANEHSQDPGNQGTDGTPQGGIYKDVPKGRMVAPFEQAALSLEEGQVAPELVETDFGFHIVKLERKLAPDAKDPKAPETYDVRHILITTGVKDPDNPMAREVPVKDFVRNKLETEKEKKLIDDIVASNNIQVPDDFTVPEISEEQLKQMSQPQMPPMSPMSPDDFDDHGDHDHPPAPKDAKPQAPQEQ